MRIVVLVSRDADWALELGAAWSAAGDDVTAVLCDHAAARARSGHPSRSALETAADAGVTLHVHDDALAARGIGQHALAARIKPVGLDEIADLLVDGADKAVWL